jgi:formate-dependent phosphoribosylglycinamide formyltransferase (GAR transformylase)
MKPKIWPKKLPALGGAGPFWSRIFWQMMVFISEFIAKNCHDTGMVIMGTQNL